MTRQWQPGDVAVLGNDIGLVVSFHTHGCPKSHPDTGLHLHYADGDWDHVTINHRPLVVIDPEDSEQVQTFALALKAAALEHDSDGAYFTHIASNALRSLIAPPKPEEPTGLGAVVEDADGDRWVHVGPGESFPVWAPADVKAGRTATSYADIAAVKVLSEGVTQ